MAELGITIVQKLMEVMGSDVIKEICGMMEYKSHLEDLQKTVSTIKNVLIVADAKGELTNDQQGYIAELKAALYDANDLFDEFLTLAELDRINGNRGSGKLADKVRRFFSFDKKRLSQAFKVSHKVKEIKKKLDAIADNHSKFGLSIDYKPICRRRQETCSFNANDIIGRDQDKENIVNMLLHPDCRFLTIVGVGGLGKTVVAQHVFNDERIKKEFPDEKNRLWVCVSDQDGEQFDVKSILRRILELISPDEKLDDSSSLQLVQMQFREKLGQRKYLLVLDDVWNEDREKWVNLKEFIMLDQEGSRILVTTRSEMTANIIDAKYAYKLEGLSKEDSWLLFEKSAFQEAHEQENYDKLVKIGKNIVEKCHRIPLAIKVVGSLLYGQHMNKWQSFARGGLAGISKDDDNRIMSILKLSYQNLKPSLKSCFSYCALFPKDFRFEKKLLIGLWMAQGYIVQLDGGQTLEDAAEEHFLILLHKCFFQDVIKDKFGDVKSVKIHDLMHDVAQEVGREEIHIVTSRDAEDQLAMLGDKIRHVRFVGNENLANPLCCGRIRSCISWPTKNLDLDNWVCLRAMDLSYCGIISLPNSIRKLLFLRYLNLSENRQLKVLPDSITELYNLQTLILFGCGLREFPREFCKLVKLRHLDIQRCGDLAYMPLGMDKLTNLRILTYYVVGKRIPLNGQIDDELKALKVLTNIKGDIVLYVGKNYRNDNVKRVNERGIGYLNRLEHLRGVVIDFEFGGAREHERLLEDMEPHPNLKSLMVHGYEGTTIRKWGRAENNWAISLPLLVYINLKFCKKLQQIPSLSQLRDLKSLTLWGMSELEYVEKRCSNDTEAALFFPSLEVLKLGGLKKLEGWWSKEGLVVDDENHFPRLSILIISHCPNLTSFPHCPNLEKLELDEVNKRLQIIVNTQDGIKLRNAQVDNVAYLKSLPAGSTDSLKIEGDEEVESLSVVGEEFIKSHALSLRRLTIERCKNMTSQNGLALYPVSRRWRYVNVLHLNHSQKKCETSPPFKYSRLLNVQS